MHKTKIIISMATIFLIVFLTTSSSFAGADITVSFDKSTADIGDLVTMVVTITNSGPGDLSDIKVLAPIPSGLKFMTSATGTTKNLYNSSTGIWQVDNLRLSSKEGGKKTLNITLEVLPELAGKTVTANASYQKVTDSSGLVPLKSAESQPLVTGNARNKTANGTSGSTNDTHWGTYALMIVTIVVIIGVGWGMMKRK